MAAAEAKQPYPARQPAVQLVCPQCGAVFGRPAWRVRQAERMGTTLRCSYECTHAARRTRTPESKAEYHRAYRERNRAWINEKQHAARFGSRREEILRRDREAYYRRLDVERARARDYCARHRQEVASRREAWGRDNPERVYWHSVRSNIAAQMGVKPRMVPDYIVDARVEFLTLRRAILAAQGMSTGTAKTPKAVEGRSPASPVTRSGRRPDPTTMIPIQGERK